MRHARAFLEEGDKVKATVVFKGREIAYKQLGAELLERFTESISDIAKVEALPKMEGRQMIAYYVADKTKKKNPEKEKQPKIDKGAASHA